MSDVTCPVCGGKLTVTLDGVTDPFSDVATVICQACKEKDIIPFGGAYTFSLEHGKTWSEIAQAAKKMYAEKRASLIGKKWVEITDDTPTGNYYGSGGEWVEEDADE